MTAYVCTRDRLVRLRRDGSAWPLGTVLEGHRLQCVAAAGGRVLAGTLGGGVLRSDDAGATWDRVELPEADVFSVAISAADGTLYAGTEPSRLFAARDGGPWSELAALQDVPSRPRWSFPPRPWPPPGGGTRPAPPRADRLLVGIELGGVLASEDGGATFSD